MVSAVITPQIGAGMAEAARRVNESPAQLKERIAELERERAALLEKIAALNAQIAQANAEAEHRAIAAAVVERDAAKYMEADGKLIGNQRQYCDYWGSRNIKQYQVSRWIKSGELKTVYAYGHTWVILTQEPPPAKRRGKQSR